MATYHDTPDMVWYEPEEDKIYVGSGAAWVFKSTINAVIIGEL